MAKLSKLFYTLHNVTGWLTHSMQCQKVSYVPARRAFLGPDPSLPAPLTRAGGRPALPRRTHLPEHGRGHGEREKSEEKEKSTGTGEDYMSNSKYM